MKTLTELFDYLIERPWERTSSDTVRALLDSSTDIKPLLRMQTDVKRRAQDDVFAKGGVIKIK